MRSLELLIESGLVKIEKRASRISRAPGTRSGIVFHFATRATLDAAYDMQSNEGRQINHLAVARALDARLHQALRFERERPVQGLHNRLRSRKPNGKSARRYRRGSLTPTKERLVSEIELLPKIASHMERAGKLLAALELYFKAGRTLAQAGISSATTMFRTCIELSEKLGDEVSQFMLAEVRRFHTK